MKNQAAIRTTVVKIVCVAALIFSLGWFLFIGVIRPHGVLRDRRHRAMSIGLACKLYAAEHGGRFPDRLQQLVPSYLPDAQFLAFPSHDRSRQLDYEYFGGAETDPPDTVLIRIPPEEPGGSEVIVHADMSGTIQPTPKAR